MDLGGLEVTVECDWRSIMVLTVGSGQAEGGEGASLATVADACGGSRKERERLLGTIIMPFHPQSLCHGP
jgi:hypothetical protein